MLNDIVNELGITDPTQIINLDEIDYSSSLSGNVIAKKGTKFERKKHLTFVR